MENIPNSRILNPASNIQFNQDYSNYLLNNNHYTSIDMNFSNQISNPPNPQTLPINIQQNQGNLNNNILENAQNSFMTDVANNIPPKNIQLIPTNNNLYIEEGSENDSKKLGKDNGHIRRRSKNDIEGRTFQCKLCQKSYLSYPALYTHCKQKHNTNNSSGRGRGRPKKDIIDGSVEKSKYNPKDTSYFEKEDRKGKTTNFDEAIKNAFEELFGKNNIERNNKREIPEYKTIEEHKFLNDFLHDKHDTNITNTNEEDENKMTDLVLIEYLNQHSNYCKPEYYTKLIEFVTLFREHVNIFNKNKVKEPNKKYTEINNAEDVPDTSNEFITEFLDPESNQEDFGFSKEESINLTQNLCHWMYEKNFTCSKLSLIQPDKYQYQ
jgi:hypothetical protein